MRLWLQHLKTVYRIVFSQPKVLMYPFFGCMLLQAYWMGWTMSTSPGAAFAYAFNTLGGMWLLCAPLLGNIQAKQTSHMPTLPLSDIARLLVETVGLVLLAATVMTGLWWLNSSHIISLYPPKMHSLGEHLLALPLLASCAIAIFVSYQIHKYQALLSVILVFLWGAITYTLIGMGWLSHPLSNLACSGLLSLVYLALLKLPPDRLQWNWLKRQQGVYPRPFSTSPYPYLVDLMRSTLRWLSLAIPLVLIAMWNLMEQRNEAIVVICIIGAMVGTLAIMVPSWRTQEVLQLSIDDQEPISPMGAGNLLPHSKRDLLRQIYAHGILSTLMLWVVACLIFVLGRYVQQHALQAPSWRELVHFVIIPICIIAPFMAAILVYRAARARGMLLGLMAVLLSPAILTALSFWFNSTKLANAIFGQTLDVYAMVFAGLVALYSLRLPYYLWPRQQRPS